MIEFVYSVVPDVVLNPEHVFHRVYPGCDPWDATMNDTRLGGSFQALDAFGKYLVAQPGLLEKLCLDGQVNSSNSCVSLLLQQPNNSHSFLTLCLRVLMGPLIGWTHRLLCKGEHE